MSQADYDVANQLMDAGRTDLNLQLVAGVTNNSGATEPSTTFAYMWWPDTTTGIMKQRNAANTAWISIFALATGIPIAARKNSIINGDFNIWQRGTSFTSVANVAYTADRFNWQFSGDGVIDITQDADTKDGLSESSLKIDVTTADATLAASDFYTLVQHIEGFNTIPFGMGSSDAVQITLSFNVKSAKTGIHGVSFRSQNVSGYRSYIAEYTINTADTWESKTITITGDVSGSSMWVKDNSIGLSLFWGLASGSTFAKAPGSWGTGNFIASTNQVNVMDSTANNFFIDQVQLEVGSVATDFEQRLYGNELALCHRYYQLYNGTLLQHTANMNFSSNNNLRCSCAIPIMRVAATATGTISFVNGNTGSITALINAIRVSGQSDNATNQQISLSDVTLDAEL